MQNYAVKKTFMPDDKLEMRYLDDKAEEVMVSFILLKLSTEVFVKKKYVTIFIVLNRI